MLLLKNPYLAYKKFRIGSGNIIGKVTQFGIILSHRDKQAIQHTSKQEANEKEADGGERANKTARVNWGRGKREANGK